MQKLRCYSCRQLKPDEEFNLNRGARGRRGRQGYCRACNKARHKVNGNGKPPVDMRTPSERMADARAKLDPGPLYDTAVIDVHVTPAMER